MGGDYISWSGAERVLFKTSGSLAHWKKPSSVSAAEPSLGQGMWAALTHWGTAEEAEWKTASPRGSLPGAQVPYLL